MRRNFGSSIAGATAGETDQWMARNFRQYLEHEDRLPVDSHELIALVAPRALLLQTGKFDHAADPRGEFLAAQAAEPVYALFGKHGLGGMAWPPAAPVFNDIGYVRHNGGHGPVPGDWPLFAAFLSRHFGQRRDGGPAPAGDRAAPSRPAGARP